MLRTGLAAALATLLIGATPAEPLRVTWSAHEGCPSRDTWWQSVIARSARIRRAQTDEQAHAATIRIERSGALSMGTFVLDNAEPRAINATTCGEVVEAIALMTVMALDPGAVAAPPPPPSTPISSVSVVPTALAPTAAPPADVAPSPAPALPPASRTLHAAATLGGAALAAGAVGFGANAGVDMQPAGREYAFRMTFSRVGSDVVRHPRGFGAAFVWTTVRLQGCLPLPRDLRLAFHACTGFEGGTIEARPNGVPNARGAVRPWLVPQLFAQLEWRVFAGVALEADFGAGMPLLREDFVVDPDAYIYRPSPVIGRATLGLKLNFL